MDSRERGSSRVASGFQARSCNSLSSMGKTPVYSRPSPLYSGLLYFLIFYIYSRTVLNAPMGKDIATLPLLSKAYIIFN